MIGQHATSAMKATANPLIDGNVIDDPAWADTPAVSTFIQKTPDEGEPVSEETIVKVMYSEKYFYVSIIAYDREPSGIVISDTRRDASLNLSLIHISEPTRPY